MTLVLGAAAFDFVVVAADRRVQVGASAAGPFTIGEDDKLFEVDRCSVASFGISPHGLYVPAFIRGFRGRTWTPESLARAVLDEIRKLGDQGDFGLLIAGTCTSGPELWEVARSARDCTRLQSGILHERENTIGVQGETVDPDGDSAQERMLEALREGSLRFPFYVGPPYDTSLLRRDRPPQTTRHPL